jgi:hypothetical protein
VVARDPRIVWPDGIFADDRYVYFVLGQWNRLPGFNGGANRPTCSSASRSCAKIVRRTIIVHDPAT